MADGKRHAPKGPIKNLDPSAPAPMTPPARCKAHSSRTGKPCRQWPIAGSTVCRTHGGAAPQVKRKAIERLLAMQDTAIDRLDALMRDARFPSTSYAAVRDVLDRTMGKPAESVAVEHSGGIKIIHELAD